MGIDAYLCAKESKKAIWIGRFYNLQNYGHRQITSNENDICDRVSEDLQSGSLVDYNDTKILFENMDKSIREDLDPSEKDDDTWITLILRFIELNLTSQFFVIHDCATYYKHYFVDTVPQLPDAINQLGSEAYAYKEVEASDIMSSTLDSGCKHEWLYYQGLTDAYYYCKHCDEKKE